MNWKFLAAPIAALTLGTSATALEDRVLSLPADYASTLEQYMISDRLGQEDQVIALYANETARTAARAGETLPDGSVIVGEIYGVKKDGDDIYESPLGRRVPTELKAIVMMERQAAWADQYPDDLKLGGWEFEVFSPSGENLAKDTAGCRECHSPLGDTDYTWSLEHIGAAN